MVVRWSKRAQTELKKAYEYIKMDSLASAEKVRDNIVRHTEALANNPEVFPSDKYKADNNGQYRAFEIYHYRISYKIMKETVLIVRMRHTSMSPLRY